MGHVEYRQRGDRSPGLLPRSLEHAADLASLAEVRTLAQAIQRDYERIDVLVNNAGVLLRDRQVSKDGHELHFAVSPGCRRGRRLPKGRMP